MLGHLDVVLGRMTSIAQRVRQYDEVLSIELLQEVSTLRRAFLPGDEQRDQTATDVAAVGKRGCC